MTHISQAPPAHAVGRQPIALRLGIFWLALVGVLVWLHTRVALAPPVYDAFTYFFKARAVWDQLAAGHLVNPLNIPPSFRPPGTVVMAYPFGFNPDFRWFYFRSVYLPIVLVFAAVILASCEPPRRLRNADPLTVLAACFFCTLSLFYYFELEDGISPVSYWGLVDSFLCGLAALSTACAIRSARRRSIPWASASILLGVLMIYVKPSGVLLAALVDLTLILAWLRSLLVEFRTGTRTPVVRRVGVLLLAEVVLSGGAVLLATHSLYLGAGNMAYGQAALTVLRNVWQVDFLVLPVLIWSAFGPFIPVALAALAVIWAAHRVQHGPRADQHRDDMQIGLAILVVTFGFWFWIYGSGGATQVRYFAPFLYVAIICAVGPFMRTLQFVGQRSRSGVTFLMGLAVLNTTLILVVPHPARMWQRLAGVDVVAGSHPASLDQAKFVIDHTPPDSENIQVYSIDGGLQDAMFEGQFDMQQLKSTGPSYAVVRPMDWQHLPTFRTTDIVSANYILFGKDRDPKDAIALARDPFVQEESIFHDWAASLTAADGIEVISREPGSGLLQITDRAKLRHSLETLVNEHHWRAVFYDANPRTWWTDSEVDEALGKATAKELGIRFGDQFEMKGLALRRIGDDATVEAWVRPMNPSVRGDWTLYVHWLDQNGQLLQASDIHIGRPDAPPADAPNWYLHQAYKLPAGATQLGFGIYRGAVKLHADKGERDWSDTRVRMAIPK